MQLVLTGTSLGVCTAAGWTNDEADCRCIDQPNSCPQPPPHTNVKCNYYHSVSSCDRSVLGAPCVKNNNERGACVAKGWSGEEADCDLFVGLFNCKQVHVLLPMLVFIRLSSLWILVSKNI